jgi:hypothetical protein
LTRKWVNAFATQGFAPPDSKDRRFGLTEHAPRPRTTDGVVPQSDVSAGQMT